MSENSAEESSGSHPKRSTRSSAGKKSSKLEAFEKFKQLKKGNINKYETEEVDSIYETVDEKEYLKRVLNRQNDDWIVDDNGSGYVEDGRDIFDDDLDAESISNAKSQGKGHGRKRNRKNRGVSNPNNAAKTMKSMFSNMNSKKKEETQISHDNTLSEILDEIDESPSCSKRTEIKPFIPKKLIAQSYLKKLEIQTPAKKPRLMPQPVDEIKEDKQNSTKCGEKTTIMVEKVKITESKKNSSECEESIKNNSEKTGPNNVDNYDKFDDLDFYLENVDWDIEDHRGEMPPYKDKDVRKQAEISAPASPASAPASPESKLMFDFQEYVASLTDDVSELFNEPYEENEEVFKFFWWDAYEDPNKHQGTVFLFGKTFSNETKTFISCCVAVQNIEKQIFLLPKPFKLDENGDEVPVTYKDIYEEFSALVAAPIKLNFRARLISKKYVFDPEISTESDYLEVQYPASSPEIFVEPLEQTPKTFTKVFGLKTTMLERLLIHKKLRGPCWLQVNGAEINKNPKTWCKIEINCSSMANLIKVDENAPPPPLVISTINLRCTSNNADKTSEIIMLSCITKSTYYINKPAPAKAFDDHFCAVASKKFPANIHEHLSKFEGTRVQKLDSERALLKYFIAQFIKVDADVVVGHDLKGFQADLLANRLSSLKIDVFSKFGRLRRKIHQKYGLALFTGRLLADIKVVSRELIKSKSYDLPVLCKQILKIPEKQLVDLQPDEISNMCEQSSNVLELIKYTMQDSLYILKIFYELNILPLALQITNIAGNVMSSTLTGGRSERNEYLLMHAFTDKGYIVPDRASSNTETQKKTFTGGLVLEPKIGFYDSFILLMDFNSLYPSIIQEYNICFTTLGVSDDDTDLTVPQQDLPAGVLPTEIRKLVESRKQVKQLMNAQNISAELKMQYHIRQMALKLTANSMYGCLGFSRSRFYARNLAALITQKGREILTITKDLVEKQNLDVVYGDTDSIMINTNLVDFDKVLKIGYKIKHEINKAYKMVELEIDGVFKYLLLLKKKKYAAVTLTRLPNGTLKEETELKGLDIVRRDWSEIACVAGKCVLEQILSNKSEDERCSTILSYMRKLAEDLKKRKVPLQLLIITKQLTRLPQLYATADRLAHVQVALRYNSKHGGHFRAGDTVPYIICEDGTENSATLRGYHPEEIKAEPERLRIDSMYYLAQQIYPVVSRICEPIDSIDCDHIAECLGLDPAQFRRRIPKHRFEIGENITLPEIMFRTALNFEFKCLKCKEINIISSPIRDKIPVLLRCSNAMCTARPADYVWYIQNQLTLSILKYLEKFASTKLICEEPSCPHEILVYTVEITGSPYNYPNCTLCKDSMMCKEYSESDLYYQIRFFSYIFDFTKKIAKKHPVEESVLDAYNKLRDTVDKSSAGLALLRVDLEDLFVFMLGKRTLSSFITTE